MNGIQKVLEASLDLGTLQDASQVYEDLNLSLESPKISPDDLIIMAIHASVSKILKSYHYEIVRIDNYEPISDETYYDLLRIQSLCISRFESSDADDEIFTLLAKVNLSSITTIDNSKNPISYESNSTF
jgi:hypothetical protein